MNVEKIAREMPSQPGTKVYLVTGSPPLVKIGGTFKPLQEESLHLEEVRDWAEKFISPHVFLSLKERGHCTFIWIASNGVRFRGEAWKSQVGEGIVLFPIPSIIMSFEEIGLPQEPVTSILQNRCGLVIVAGPNGSGKTTTLASMLEWINDRREVHLLTIEDPVEYQLTVKKSIVVQREVGSDVSSAEDAIAAAMCQKPDVIAVGELRNLGVIERALSAVERGHLVLATLSSAARADAAIETILGFVRTGRERELFRRRLADALSMVIAQVLVPKADGIGWAAAFEILLNNPAAAHHVRDGQIERLPALIQTSKKLGMVTLDDFLVELCRKGVINTRDCLDYCRNNDNMRRELYQGG